MKNSIFQVLFASIRAKVIPLVTKIKLWTSWNYIRTRIFTKIRQFFVTLFDVKPRHKKDYYEIFGWLVSKRLAFATVIVLGLVSIFYVYSLFSTIVEGKKAGVTDTKTYAYNSFLLKFAKGEVRITGKSGYLAYQGPVDKGYASGMGRLYQPDGNLLYQGSFDKNRFEGQGTQFYPTGEIRYVGSFSANLYEGEGKQYRSNGNLEYEGEFSKGLKEGYGRLYDSGNNPVYTGNFSFDTPVYAELLGKTTQELSEIYTGEREVFEAPGEFLVLMDDIRAAYSGTSGEDTLNDEMKIDTVYIRQNYFMAGGKKYDSISSLKEYFGKLEYEGNSAMTLMEAVCMNRMAQETGSAGISVELGYSSPYKDYHVIEEPGTDQTIYLYSFRKNGLIYSFVCLDRGDSFLFYYIENEQGGASET